MLSRDLSSSLQETMIRHQRPLIQVLAATATGIFTYFTYKDYQLWREIMIPSGVPQNFVGYIFSNLATILLRKDRRNPKQTDKSANYDLTKGFLKEEEIPVFTGQIPKTAKWSIPHRQVDPPKSKEMWLLTEGLLEEIKTSHPETNITLAPSQIEENLEALFIGQPISRNEVVHLHPKDGTFHVYLSAYDAELVLKKGWGELFALKGKYIPPKLESVLIFAAQSKDDIQVHRKFINAALQTKAHQLQYLQDNAAKK